jgi:hypothetical protein
VRQPGVPRVAASTLVLLIATACLGEGTVTLDADPGQTAAVAAVTSHPFAVPERGPGSPGARLTASPEPAATPPSRAPVRLVFDFNSSSHGFVLEEDTGASTVGWNPREGRIDITADRRSPLYERYMRRLPFALTPATSFTATSRFGMVARGHHQDVFGLLLMQGAALEVTSNVSYVRFYERGGSQGEEPELANAFFDLRGRRRIEEWNRVGWGREYRLSIAYDAPSRTMEVSIRGESGVLIESGSYVVGSQADDGFSYDRIGVGIARRNEGPEPPSRVWVDDIVLTATPGPRQPERPDARH